MYKLAFVVSLLAISFYTTVKEMKRFHRRSYTSEAKIQLAAAYTAQQSFYSDFGTYAGCFRYMGYNPESDKINRYYGIGFKTVDIHPDFKKTLVKKWETVDLENNCFKNPKLFFENGNFRVGRVKVTQDMLPDDAKLVIDKNGEMKFKIYAVSMNKEGLKSMISVDQDKKYVIEENSLITGTQFSRLGNKLFSLMGAISLFSILGIMIGWVLKSFKVPPWVELFLVLGFLITIAKPGQSGIENTSLAFLLYSSVFWVRQKVWEYEEAIKAK